MGTIGIVINEPDLHAAMDQIDRRWDEVVEMTELVEALGDPHLVRAARRLRGEVWRETFVAYLTLAASQGCFGGAPDKRGLELLGLAGNADGATRGWPR